MLTTLRELKESGYASKSVRDEKGVNLITALRDGNRISRSEAMAR
jgi:hypothetical protein